MKIVLLDGYTCNPGDLSWDGLKQYGELKVYDRTDQATENVIKNIGNADAILTNKTLLSKKVLQNVPSVKYIGVLATGYNVVDVDVAKEEGIIVTNIPTYGTDAVAQFTMALILEICHHVGAHSSAVYKGNWTNSIDFCFWNYPLVELAGKTMGIIGFGRIGRATAKVAEAFGLKILAYDTNQNSDIESDTCKYATLDELLATSDIVSLHCPLTESNKGMINKYSISKMKDGVWIINTARGPLIVDEDLKAALDNGKVGAAALDVASAEPIPEDNPLLKAKNCILTPHIAWASKESRARLINTAVENLGAFVKGNPVNVVNP